MYRRKSVERPERGPSGACKLGHSLSRVSHGSRILSGHVSQFNAATVQRFDSAFTLIEILIAIGILGMVLAAIFSSWTAILRASKVGLDAAAAVQRSRIVMRTIEDSLLCAQSFGLNQRFYGFDSKNGSDGYLSFVARLPESFPRSRKFGDLHVRRITFSIEAGAESSHQLVLRQSPLLMDLDKDENEHPLVLAKYVSDFKMEFWNARTGDWDDEWKQTNQLPKLVKFSLRFSDNANTSRQAQQELVRIVQLPATTVVGVWQMPVGIPGRLPGATNQPGYTTQPGTPQPGINPGQGFPNQYPGSGPNPNPIIPLRPQ
jgi:prepilin-type N-terminal cleavage/methylation domain-containing protein